MALTHAKIAINDYAPTLVTVEGAESSLSCTLQVQNLGTVTVYLGGEGLTSSSYGVAIAANSTLSIESLSTRDEVFALSSSGDSYVAVLRLNR
jgi:hypothetical protein